MTNLKPKPFNLSKNIEEKFLLDDKTKTNLEFNQDFRSLEEQTNRFSLLHNVKKIATTTESETTETLEKRIKAIENLVDLHYSLKKIKEMSEKKYTPENLDF